MKTLTTLSACAALGLATALPAQEPDPFRFVPADAAVVIQIDGPVQLRERFAKTNAFLMLMSPEAEEAWEMFDDGVQEMVESAREEGVDLQPFVDALGDYAGRLTISISFDHESLTPDDFDAPEPPLQHMFVTVALTPDDETDLADIAARISEAVEDSGQALASLDVGAGMFAVEDPDSEVAMGLPTVLDGHLVAAFGGRVEERMQGLLDGEGRMQPSLGEADAAAGIWMHVTPRFRDMLMAFAGHAMAEETDLQADEAAAAIQTLLRMDGFRDFTLRVRPGGSRIVEDWELRADPTLPSVVDFFQPGRAVASLLELMPRDLASFTTSGLDFDLVVDTIVGFGELLGEFDRDAMMDSFRGETGFDLQADFLDRLTGEVAVLEAPADEDAEPGMAGGMSIGMMLGGSMCLAFGLDDATVFAETVDKLLRQTGLHAARKTSEYRGRDLYSLTVGGFLQFDYGFVDGAMLLSMGPGGGDVIRGVVDRAVARAEGQEAAAWPDGVTSRLEQVTGTWRDLSVSRNVLDPNLIVMAVEESLGGMGPGGAMPEELDERTVRVIETLVRLQKEFDLETQVSVGRYEDGRLLLQRSW